MRTNSSLLIVLGLAAIFVSVELLVNVSATATVSLPPAAGPQNKEGAKVYSEKCAPCHAADGSGSTTRGKAMKVPDLRAPKIQEKTDKQLLDAVTTTAHRGLRKSIGDEKLRMIIMHTRTFGKQKD